MLVSVAYSRPPYAKEPEKGGRSVADGERKIRDSTQPVKADENAEDDEANELAKCVEWTICGTPGYRTVVSDHLKEILAEYQKAVEAAQSAEARKRELIDANPDLAEEIESHLSNGQLLEIDATVTFGKPQSDTASHQPYDAEATVAHNQAAAPSSKRRLATMICWRRLPEVAWVWSTKLGTRS